MKTRSILAFFLAIVMMMSLCTPALASNTKGVTFEAKLDESTIDVSTEDQVVTVTVNASKEITWDGIGFKAFYDSPLKLTNITNKEVTLTAGDIQVSLGSGDNGAGYQTADGENSTITNICVLHFTVPANTPAGTYNLGIQKLEITSDYGEIWENSATAMTTLTIKDSGSTPPPAEITYKATASKSVFDVSTSDQTLTVVVDANQEITWDGIGFKAFYDSPLKLTNITNKEVTLTAGDIQVSLGSGDNGAGYQTADGENSTITNICVLHFTIPANTPAGTYNLGIQKLEITKDYGEIWEASATAMTTIEIKGAPVHTCSGTFTKGQDATCTVDGWKDYYTCSCGKYYSDSACNNEITDLAAWKKGAGKIAASHDYGTLVDEDPGVHTATEVKDGMKAHYFCDTCDTYFDSSKNPTTKAALTIVNAHSYDTQYGYKENDGHADTCSCGAHNTVVGHTPNISAPTETEDQVCKFCGFVIATKTGHIHQNNLTPVEKHGATCTEDGYKAHYKCSCGLYFEDASASVEITDIDAWKAGAGKIAAEGHKYTEQKKDTAHLKTEATNCTEFDVYWYDCSVCDANAKNDPNATDKFWTSTDAGEHKFDEKLTDAAHLVAGTGANCQDVKEYYYDCAHCATIGTTTWASTEVGAHEFDTTQWGYKDKATGHAHKCKFCDEHDAVQPHTPNMADPTETEDKICTACQIVLETATGHICKSHLTKVPANGASCTVDGNIEYYECSCGKYYTDSTASVEITDKASVVIKAGHNYGTLVEEVPAKHTATELKAGMKAHYFCDKCSTYFTAEKVATTESDLVIPAPVHEYNTVNGYKEADGHADTCSCGAHNTVVPHTPDREAATETDPIKCSVCGYEITPALGHIHKNNLTKVVAEPATCTKDGNIEYYTCSCGKWFTDATASVEITDKDSVVIKAGHNYGTEWKSDKDNHWNECTCGDKANTAVHKDENSDGKCDVCEYDVGLPTNPDTPQTGDNSNMFLLWIALLFISGAGVVATTVFGKKKFSVK